MRRKCGGTLPVVLSILLFGCMAVMSPLAAAASGNRPSSTERFRDMGFGLFIHWGSVSQTGKEISLCLYDTSDDFREKYFNLYKTFNPKDFEPKRWARLARGAGMKYVVFTTKHHDGFCMFESAYTDYDIMNTPYERDITGQIADAFRGQDMAIGWYYSPADWHYLFVTNRGSSYDYWMSPEEHDEPYGTQGLPLLEYEKRQIRELLANYGDIDIMWYDGPGEELAEFTWELKPEVFIARARGTGIPTPEQEVPKPGEAPEGAWETCMTMGGQWAYKPNDRYKSARELVHKLVKIRAMGGNFLLNVGPKPDGTLPEPQVKLLKKLGRWMDVNAE
ncbi:MAG: alpha-L-fucosidase, partial [Planctomycetota bacterium]